MDHLDRKQDRRWAQEWAQVLGQPISKDQYDIVEQQNVSAVLLADGWHVCRPGFVIGDEEFLGNPGFSFLESNADDVHAVAVSGPVSSILAVKHLDWSEWDWDTDVGAHERSITTAVGSGSISGGTFADVGAAVEKAEAEARAKEGNAEN